MAEITEAEMAAEEKELMDDVELFDEEMDSVELVENV